MRAIAGQLSWLALLPPADAAPVTLAADPVDWLQPQLVEALTSTKSAARFDVQLRGHVIGSVSSGGRKGWEAWPAGGVVLHYARPLAKDRAIALVVDAYDPAARSYRRVPVFGDHLAMCAAAQAAARAHGIDVIDEAQDRGPRPFFYWLGWAEGHAIRRRGWVVPCVASHPNAFYRLGFREGARTP